MPPSDSPRVVIIGAGFAGLCLAIQLKKANIHSFTLAEKASRVGGTWRENVYPGAACDSPSFEYCYSFEQKTDWSRKWAKQPEILGYIEHCVDKYGLAEHIRFETEVESARFDSGKNTWRARLVGGDELTADFLVSCVGQLNRPASPPIAGLERFQGECFHSAEWNREYDLRKKKVAVIGNAASALQFVPEIVDDVEHLFLFQRHANWVVPKGDRRYSDREKWCLGTFRLLALLYRFWIWLSFELRFSVIRKDPLAGDRAQTIALDHLKAQVADPELRAILTPDYPIGAKRILISDDYYPAIQKPNVSIVTHPIERVERSSLVTDEGGEHEVDAIILATGFQTTQFLVPMRIEGPQEEIHETWKHGAEAYLGISVAGYPNFFMMYGPNTNLGHNSILFMLECQGRYIVECLQTVVRRGARRLDLKRVAMREYNATLQKELAGTVWADIQESWYKDERGRITNNWSRGTLAYWWRTRKVDLRAYELT